MGNQKSKKTSLRNLEKLPPRELFVELACNYLEIGDIFNLAFSSKILLECLWLSEEVWRRLALREGLTLEEHTMDTKKSKKNAFQNGYMNYFGKILENCKIFQSSLNGDYLESRLFTYCNMPSQNYINFEIFMQNIGNINILLYVLKNKKRNIILRAYIAAYGFSMLSIMDDKDQMLEELLKLLCDIEDGETFRASLDWEETYRTNIVSVALKLNLKKLNENAIHRVEDYFVLKAAFRVDCSRIERDKLHSQGFDILLRRFRDPPKDIDKFYTLIYDNLSDIDQLKKLGVESYNFTSLISYLQKFRREDSIGLFVQLLRNNSNYNETNTISGLTMQSLTWCHPTISNELFQSSYKKNFTSNYLKVLRDYMLSNEPTINLALKESILEYIVNWAKDNTPTDPYILFHYYVTWNDIDKLEGFSSFKQMAIPQLVECIFSLWEKTRHINFVPILTNLSKYDNERVINMLLDPKPALTADVEHHIIQESFKILKCYSTMVPDDDSHFYARLVNLFLIYVHNEKYHHNDQLMLSITDFAQSIKDKYPIDSLIEALEKASLKYGCSIMTYATAALSILKP